MTSRLNPMRKRTSSAERDQFSVEKAYAETARTPISMAPSTTSNRLCSPCSWPAVRGSPRWLAHRPLPSMTIATCRGTSARGTAGGRAPEGCGVGATGGLALDMAEGAQPALEVPGQVRRDERARLPQVTLVGG